MWESNICGFREDTDKYFKIQGKHDKDICYLCFAKFVTSYNYEEMESDENCWDCGINVVEEEDGGYMCTDCHRTLCWDCKGGSMAAFRDPHREGREGREEDKGVCGKTTRVL